MIKARLKRSLKKAAKLLPHQAKIISAFLAAFVIFASFPTQFVKAVEIQDSEKGNQRVYTFMSSTESILDSADIEVSGDDEVTVSVGSHATDIKISIKRAFKVYIKSAGRTTELSLTEGTVKDALGKAGYAVDQYDIINYTPEEELKAGMVIEYTNIDYVNETVEEVIPHKTVKKPDFKMKEGKIRILKEGKDGKREITTTSKYINGVLTEAEKDIVILEKAETERLVYGATSAPANSSEWVSRLSPDKKIMLDKNGVPTEYAKKMTGVASAYCTGTTCSTGVRVKPGYIAIDPSIIPYGSEMYIRTPDGGYIYGYAIAADTGGFTAWGNTIADLYVSSYSEAINFGRRNIEIYILN